MNVVNVEDVREIARRLDRLCDQLRDPRNWVNEVLGNLDVLRADLVRLADTGTRRIRRAR